MKKKLYMILSIALFVCLAILSGCAGADADPGQEAAGADNGVGEDRELRIAARATATGLEPTAPGHPSLFFVGVNAGETLVRVNSDGIIEPFLAEGIEQVDPFTWQINLRPEARFWSGRVVDADAVIASLERSRELDVAALPFLNGMSFSKIDDFTVQVDTEFENMPVLLNMSNTHLMIHNTEFTNQDVDTIDFTGRYRIVGFIPEQQIVLELNDGHWGQTSTAIRRIVKDAMTDDNARILAALSGSHHIATHIPAAGLPQFEGNDTAQIYAAPAANTHTIYLNLRQPQLGDYRVRQALSWTLDRDILNLLGAEGLSSPVTTWLGSNPAFPEARNAFFTRHDPDKAAALLDEAGWILGDDGIRYNADGDPLAIRLMTWGAERALGEAIQHQWSQLGVLSTVQHGDYGLIEAAHQTGDWDASIEAWGSFGNLAALLNFQYSPEGAANHGGFDDAETNRLLRELEDASDDEQRHEIAMQIVYRVAEQSPAIYLYPRLELTAVNTSLDGFMTHFIQMANTVNPDLRFLD